MRKASKRGERALSDLVRALDQVRGGLVQRLDEIDFDTMRKRGLAMQKRGARLAGSVRSDLERRVRPRRRRVSPAGVAGLAGLLAVGLVAVGVGVLAYDRERREAARRRLDGVRAL